MATLSRIAIHPIKSLDPLAVDRVSIDDAGGLEGDRTYAVVDEDGEYVNGKRTRAVHRLRTDVDLDAGEVTFRIEGEEERRRFDLGERGAIDAFLSEYFGLDASLVRTDGPNMTDFPDPGPTLISRATLEEAASWFPGIDPGEMRLRLRPNLVVSGVPAFWEDRLVSEPGAVVRIGDATLEANAPVPRCVVPKRDPRTGEEYEGFQSTFVERREETFPEWADPAAFEEFGMFSLMVATTVPEPEYGKELAVGEEARIVEEAETAGV